MVPHRGEKKLFQDQSTEESNPNDNIYSDTTSCLIGSIKSWVYVYEILKEEKSIISDDASEGEDVVNTNNLKDVAKSELHKVVTRPKLFPYIHDTLGSGACGCTNHDHIHPSKNYCQLFST